MNRSWPFIVGFFAAIVVGSSVGESDVRNEPIDPIPRTTTHDFAIVELGKKLFHDVRFSSDQKISCASCHSLAKGGADGRSVSLGVENRRGEVNAPTVFNSRFNFRQFWDGRAANLMEQIEGPFNNKNEMNSSWARVIPVIESDSAYLAMFTKNYEDGVTAHNVKASIVAFENTLITPNSRFDQYLRGDNQAISNEELAGYKLFKSYGCVSCHQGVNIGGNLYQKLGAVHEYGFGKGDRHLGRFNVTKKAADKYVFKVPSLRNVALTAPYLHDGSEPTLQGVVSKMMVHQLGRVSPKEDVKLVVDFLKTLTGEYQGKPLK